MISIEPIQQVACRQLFGPGPNLQYILLRGDNMALNYFIIGEEELLVRDAIMKSVPNTKATAPGIGKE